jgi:hypothetical protein
LSDGASDEEEVVAEEPQAETIPMVAPNARRITLPESNPFVKKMNSIGNHLTNLREDSVMYVLKPADFDIPSTNILRYVCAIRAIGLQTTSSVALYRHSKELFSSSSMKVGERQMLFVGDFVAKLKILYNDEGAKAAAAAADVDDDDDVDDSTLHTLFGAIAPITFFVDKYAPGIVPFATGQERVDYLCVLEALAGDWLTINRSNYLDRVADDLFTKEGCEYMLTRLQVLLLRDEIDFVCFA